MSWLYKRLLDSSGLRHSLAQFSSMFLTSRELLWDSNKALNIVFYSKWLPTNIWKRSLSYYITSVSAAVLIILLCTVAILHYILRRQQRQYVQSLSSPHSMVILHISTSESYVQEKIDHENTVSSIQVSRYTSFPRESECPFRFSHLSPSSLEKASDNDISNRMMLCLSTSDISLL